jgi:hypothetical protein
MRSAGQGLAPRRRSDPHQVRSDAAFSARYNEALSGRAEERMRKHGEILEKLERGDIDPSSARVLLDGLKFHSATTSALQSVSARRSPAGMAPR